ncbi:hypothetical protein IGI04_030737, partial [Brassica rapa subsp. trilocularis]
SGERPARERACRRRSLSFRWQAIGLGSLHFLPGFPPCPSSGQPPSLESLFSGGKTRSPESRWLVSFPGGGGYDSSAAAGFSRREAEVPLTSPSSAQAFGRAMSFPTSVQKGEEESWLWRRLEGMMSSGEMRASVVLHGASVRRRRSGRGGETRGVLMA